MSACARTIITNYQPLLSPELTVITTRATTSVLTAMPTSTIGQDSERTIISYPLPARLFRALFRSSRPRGYMRLGTWMARAYPSMQALEVPLSEGISITLDLRKIDHQPIFLDGFVAAEAQERNLLTLLVPEGGTAIDVGAHLGIYTVTLAQLVGPRGLVVAYEPCPDDLRVNTFTLPQVVVRPFAVCEADQLVVFHKERSAALSRIVTASASSSQDFAVAGVTLDAEIARLRLSNVDFLKIDVEGGEGQVLSGAAKLLSGASPPVLLFEWVPGFSERWKKSVLAVLREIIGNGWRLFRVGWSQPTREIIGFEEPLEEANIFGFPPCRTDALTRFLEHTKLDGTETK